MKHKLKSIAAACLAAAIVFTGGIFVPAKASQKSAVRITTSAASKAKINKSKLTLYVKDTAALKIKGTSKKPKWSSTNKAVAAVNSRGKVTAKKAGTATIKAKVGSKTYKCKVTVKALTAVTMIKGRTYTLQGPNGKNAKWSSTKKTVASVNSDGTVTAKKAGTAYIFSKLKSKPYNKYKVTVKAAKINKTSHTMNAGASYLLSVTGASVSKWTSSNTSVATVSNGNVTAKKAGVATITATVGVNTLTCKVTVKSSHTHSYTSKITKAATCTTTGIRTYTCTTCGATKTETIPATGHSYVTTTTEPTCTSSGSKVSKCTICGNTKTETIPATGHSYTYKTTQEPTCANAGVKTGTCTKCGNTVTQKINPTGEHNYTTTRTEPTCTTSGSEVSKCTICGDTKTETIPATGHSYTSKVTKKATCAASGVKTYTCSRCGNTYTESIPKLTEHSWDNGKVTTNPTCTAEGVKTYTCTVCGTTKTESIPASHTPKRYRAEKRGYYECTVCEQRYYLDTTYDVVDEDGVLQTGLSALDAINVHGFANNHGSDRTGSENVYIEDPTGTYVMCTTCGLGPFDCSSMTEEQIQEWVDNGMRDD